MSLHLLVRERAARAEAEAQRRALRDLLMQVPAVLSIQRGPDHVYELSNPLHRALVGGRDVEGSTFADAAPHVIVPGLLHQLDQVYTTGEPFIGREVRVELHQEGSDEPSAIFLNGVLQPIRGADGAVQGVMTFAFDITAEVEARQRVERLAAENALLLEEARRARARAEEASRAKDVFLATVSHELRTPLTAVVGWTQMLRAGVVPDGRRARAIDVIDRNARALSQLVEDLIDIGRITAGKLKLARERAPLAPLVEAALEAVRPVADAKGVRLEAALDPAVGAADVDPGRLQQVVWNLACNAVKFTPGGGAVRVSLRAAGQAAEIMVEDTGQGIDADLLPHIFEPFRQGPGEAGPRSGLGLGLAIAQRLIELHGGRLEAWSDGPGRGARFTAAIPLARADR
ncbi:MAG: HAMP domain-containing histidine kinase [Polyangiaceae bacterium]|nr:HAMP domain-containing histidine kinase [Polyangiaceae bacterium]